jgi:hypothetical protein
VKMESVVVNVCDNNDVKHSQKTISYFSGLLFDFRPTWLQRAFSSPREDIRVKFSYIARLTDSHIWTSTRVFKLLRKLSL